RRGLALSSRGLAAASFGWGPLAGGTVGAGIILLSLLMAAGLEGAAVVATDAVVSIGIGLAKFATFGLAGVVNAKVLALELLLALGRAPGRGEILAHQLGINPPERAAHLLREGEVRLPIRAVEIIVENAADAAHLAAVAQVEIFVAPVLVLLIGRDRRMRVASRPHRGMKRERVGIVLPAARVEHRRQIRAAAEPGLGGRHQARVHVNRRHVRVLRMGDERNAGGPKPRVGFGARNVLAEFARELAENRGAVDADLLA